MSNTKLFHSFVRRCQQLRALLRQELLRTFPTELDAVAHDHRSRQVNEPTLKKKQIIHVTSSRKHLGDHAVSELPLVLTGGSNGTDPDVGIVLSAVNATNDDDHCPKVDGESEEYFHNHTLEYVKK